MTRASTVLLAGVLVLAACAGSRGPSPAGDGGGAASCSRSCSRDYDVCMEAGAARGSNGTLRGLSCDRQFRQCTAACRAAS
jgi:hypothetical protein